MVINLIAAFTRRKHVLGASASIPWSIPLDKARFKTITVGLGHNSNAVIMGKKTFLSIGRPLPNRVNIVVSSSLPKIPNVAVVPSLQAAFSFAEKSGCNDVFLCGGRAIYAEGFRFCTRLFLTIVKGDYAGDVYFPPLDLSDFVLSKKEEHADCTFLDFIRKGTQ